MALFEDEPPAGRKVHELGQPLDGLSVHEIDERIAMLRTEITRLEDERRRKGEANSAAEMAFKPTLGQG